MKKFLAVILSLLLMFAMTACDKDAKDADSTTSNTSQTVNTSSVNSGDKKSDIVSKSSQTTSSSNKDTSSKEQKPKKPSSEETESNTTMEEYQGIKLGTVEEEFVEYIPEDFPEENVDFTQGKPNANKEPKIHKISTADDLKEFANTVNCGYSYQYSHVVLMSDIDLSGIEWKPIGSIDRPFMGIFLGNGHTISNLTITAVTDQMIDARGSTACIGFFGCAEEATIKDLCLENVNISIKNDSDAGFVKVGSLVGFMVAYDEGISLTGCSASGNINIAQSGENVIEAGGIVGNFNANRKDTFYNLQFVHSNVNISAEGFICELGGIAGMLGSWDSDPSDSYIGDLIYTGKIDDNKVKRGKLGGICGVYHSGYRSDIKNCFVKLEIVKTGFNEHTDMEPILGVIIGDQTVNTDELGLENVYGSATLNGKFQGLSFVGRAHNHVYYKQCEQTNEIPESADAVLTNWDISDRTSPKFAIEIK